MGRFDPPNHAPITIGGVLLAGALVSAGGVADASGVPMLAAASRGLAVIVACGLTGWLLTRIGATASRLVQALERLAEAPVWYSATPRVPALAAAPEIGTQAIAPGRDVATLKAQLEAAREAHDPDRVLEVRLELLPLLDQDAQDALDRDLGGWLIRVIQRRLVGGNLTVEVVDLAGRVAEALATTKEGASLRASLPTLRRGAGLCPRCGDPYQGIDDACPKCLAVKPVFTPIPDEDDEYLPESGDGPRPDDMDLPPS
jgi:hypothetical protein